jgi:hypothetical protein
VPIQELMPVVSRSPERHHGTIVAFAVP